MSTHFPLLPFEELEPISYPLPHKAVSVEKGGSGRGGVRDSQKNPACSEVLQAGVLEPRTGLEPVTYALRMRRSTN